MKPLRRTPVGICLWSCHVWDSGVWNECGWGYFAEYGIKWHDGQRANGDGFGKPYPWVLE
jgi:hypothetical protein